MKHQIDKEYGQEQGNKRGGPRQLVRWETGETEERKRARCLGLRILQRHSLQAACAEWNIITIVITLPHHYKTHQFFKNCFSFFGNRSTPDTRGCRSLYMWASIVNVA